MPLVGKSEQAASGQPAASLIGQRIDEKRLEATDRFGR